MRFLFLLCLFPIVAFAQSHPTEQEYLSAVVPPDLVGFSNLEVAGYENLSIQTSAGEPFLQFQMSPTQARVNKGNRAELSVDYPFVVGDTVEYSWRLRIPHGSATDAGRNRWWLLAQWHDQPDIRHNQTWANYPENSPSIALGYGVVNGQDTLSLTYGAPYQSNISYTTLERGVWHDLRAEITWSGAPDGKAVIYLDGVEFASAQGRNMYNSYQHYFKIGTYRHPEIRVSSQIDLDDVSIRHILAASK